MKNNIKIVLGLAAASLLTQGTQALPITGVIDINGTASLNGTLASASAVNSVTGAGVDFLTQTGAYLGTDGDAVTMSGFSWPSSTAVNPLWTFTGGANGWTYSFDMSSISVVSQSPTFLDLQGLGTVSIVQNGTGLASPYTTTAAEYSFTISESGPKSVVYNFGFDSETSSIPDGGATVALLGSALTGLSLIRRKIGA